MTIHQFMYLNLRPGIYNKSQREWLFQKAVSCLDRHAVLEVHSHSNLMVERTLTLRPGLRYIAFKDRPNHMVTQICQRYGGHQTSQSVGDDQAFYIDGRCIDGVQIARQTIHLLHKPQRFTPSLRRLVVWTSHVPHQLMDLLHDEGWEFDVCDTPRVGLVTTILARRATLYLPSSPLVQGS
ncbi:hypothetical protein [Alicyclobacillus ferrooxydans]|uniref:Uncharacterized protein n=1 Tax=Alicyclobacillus ferrooxydans TaxID=471514 RepID=A0A0P9EEJ5_9BACL|nr:hypothetical protein [Alicyclobacillus ferrooxydans]KPV40782.1 hypothetical protein AN477_20915 [Alicyclobacillus ferrooxydans]